MPNSARHKSQISHNKELLDEQLFDPKGSKYLDWVITICYYCVVHLIDQKLAELGIDEVGIHDERKRLIKQRLASKYTGLYNNYINLEKSSRKARYHCLPIKLKEVESAFITMQVIEEMFT